MIYKNFRVMIALRVLLLAASITALVYLWLTTALVATLVLLAVAILYQLYALIRYAEQTSRDLTRFLHSIRHEDFTQTFTSDLRGKDFVELSKAFESVVEDFRRARAGKEEQFQYLQTVVQHIGVGLVSFDDQGEIELFNTAALRLLRLDGVVPKTLQSLGVVHPLLAGRLGSLRSGGKSLVKISQGLQPSTEAIQVIVRATAFRLGGKQFTLASLQDIQQELEETELEAWRKLIRVLTHEIMNSVTPISSLASTVIGLLNQAASQGGELQPEDLYDVQSGLGAIQKRSEGLLHFIDAYRNLARVPAPEFKLVMVRELFENAVRLFGAEFKEKRIEVGVKVEPESLELVADPALIEQVLINLLLNSIDAMTPSLNGERVQPRLHLSAFQDGQGRTVIEVEDNGAGLTAEAQEKIFIPFFTTKPSGSGIGLSLSRELMRLHHGTISVRSEPKVATTFTLRF
ncbi:MAG: ATP-binding protein [Rhizobacter sp.]|nr:ATP-binding protein [Chlorobiales bacterium]